MSVGANAPTHALGVQQRVMPLPVLFQDFHSADFREDDVSPQKEPQKFMHRGGGGGGGGAASPSPGVIALEMPNEDDYNDGKGRGNINSSSSNNNNNNNNIHNNYSDDFGDEMRQSAEFPHDETSNKRARVESVSQQELDLAFPSVHNIFAKEKPYFCALNTFLLLASIAVALLMYDEEQHGGVAKFWGVYALIVPVYTLYCLEAAFLSPTSKYLRNVMSFDGLKAYFEKVKGQAPVVEVTARAYHYRHMDKSVTYTARQTFDYREAKDLSADITPLLDHLSVFRLHVQLRWRCAQGAAAQNFEREKQMLITHAKTRDCHVDIETKGTLPKLKTHIITYATENDRPPLLNLFWYALFTLLGLSLPYRLYLNACTGYIEYSVMKLILC